MPPHKHRKGSLIVATEERTEQRAVGLLAHLLVSGKMPDVAENCSQFCGRHLLNSLRLPRSEILCPAGPKPNMNS